MKTKNYKKIFNKIYKNRIIIILVIQIIIIIIMIKNYKKILTKMLI